MIIPGANLCDWLIERIQRGDEEAHYVMVCKAGHAGRVPIPTSSRDIEKMQLGPRDQNHIRWCGRYSGSLRCGRPRHLVNTELVHAFYAANLISPQTTRAGDTWAGLRVWDREVQVAWDAAVALVSLLHRKYQREQAAKYKADMAALKETT